MIATLSATFAAAAGCLARSGPTESFEITAAEARQDRTRMRAAPVALDRPVVVLAGYRAFPTLAYQVVWRLAPMTSGSQDDFLPISYTFQTDIEKIAAEAIRQIDERWPSDDPDRTIEVDVVGVSMGGLVARTAALPMGELPGGEEIRTKRLRINTLYSMGSPHMGAKLANVIAPDSAARNMKPGSAFIKSLNGALPERDYAIVPYAVLNDNWVGATNSAPPGFDPIWTPGTHAFSHFMITRDERIMADTARRLRGEDPIGTPSPAPRD
ncbi:MAG: hypothetical protein AAGF47_00290 [Planctomycetota bacterium]